VAAGLSDIHFDAMMRCVEKSLQESHVQQEHIDQVLPVIEKHRRDILNR
jgi:truncated hemoglobin YjbI